MIPFNLKEYTKNPNRKIVTRDGRAVTKILCTDAKGDYPIVALIEGHDSTFEISCSYTNNGEIYSSNIKSSADLFFAPEKHEGWVNLYKRNRFADYITGNVFFNELEAKMNIIKDSNLSYINTIKIEWEE